MFKRYPYGGFCEYMLAPQAQVVKIPDNMSFVQGSRMGYLGTSYAALKKCGPLMGRSLIINGASGTLGIGATLFALSMGVGKIYAVARGDELLARLKALAPDRIETFSNRTGSSGDFIKASTGGRRCRPDARHARRQGAARIHARCHEGCAAAAAASSISAVLRVICPSTSKWWMDEQMELIGSVWFTAAEGMEIASMVENECCRHLRLWSRRFGRSRDINEAISGADLRRWRLHLLRRHYLDREPQRLTAEEDAFRVRVEGVFRYPARQCSE